MQAADFFQDERTTATLTDIIGPKVLSGRPALTDELSAAVQVRFVCLTTANVKLLHMSWYLTLYILHISDDLVLTTWKFVLQG